LRKREVAMIANLPAVIGFVSFALFASMANAGDIYRWVDENGQTHVADTVPPQYRKSATKIDARASEVSESQRAEAAARAARQKAAITDPSRPASSNPPASGELSPEIKPGASGLNDKRARCDDWRRAYEQSQACFNRYRTVSGAIRSEGYQRCTEVSDPATECGAPTN
jgi:hypothetical protein